MSLLIFITGFYVGIWTLFFAAVKDHHYSTALMIRIVVFYLSTIALGSIWIISYML